ncbi:MAG: hypothetical protein IT366_21640 [Candidatus Hydrogenedentes bacterium]|nr:hypothetical protein [Candidatus Hydrogenedentota bacterium]
MNIDDLELSIRSHNGLSKAGIDTVEKLANISWEEFNSIQNIGTKSVSEIVWQMLQLFNGDLMRMAEEWNQRFPAKQRPPADFDSLRVKAKKYDKIAAIVLPRKRINK